MSPVLSAEAIRKMVSYYYLLSYCPPQHFGNLRDASLGMRTRLAAQAALSLEEFTRAAAAEAAFRIAAFHGSPPHSSGRSGGCNEQSACKS
ncbi:MAG: hypothetical protein JXA25_12870 [Anaerolineales bacterium]|nr:hypothetical protein [Anaerolineales bacterium]